MIGNMLKAEEKLKLKYDKSFPQNLPSASTLPTRPNHNFDDE
jgi:hypothetical protein